MQTLTLYNTLGDIFKRVSYRKLVLTKLTYYANVLGIKEVHRGVEVDLKRKTKGIGLLLTVCSLLEIGTMIKCKATFINDETNSNSRRRPSN